MIAPGAAARPRGQDDATSRASLRGAQEAHNGPEEHAPLAPTPGFRGLTPPPSFERSSIVPMKMKNGTANSAGTSTAIHSYGPFGEPNVTTGVRYSLLPMMHAAINDMLSPQQAAEHLQLIEQHLLGHPVPSFLRMGQWIGGDRDGNPNVDAGTHAKITTGTYENKFGIAIADAQTKPLHRPPDLWLLFAPIKKARTDFIVEKAVELGAARILPVQTRHTNSERIRQDRLQAHAVEARHAEVGEHQIRLDVGGPGRLELRELRHEVGPASECRVHRLHAFRLLGVARAERDEVEAWVGDPAGAGSRRVGGLRTRRVQRQRRRSADGGKLFDVAASVHAQRSWSSADSVIGAVKD